MTLFLDRYLMRSRASEH